MERMQWDKWSGFEGDGVYTIFNKASLTCLEPDDKAHWVTFGSKRWNIRGSYVP